MNKILLIGCGDIALRLARLLGERHQLFGLIRNPDYLPKLKAANIMPIIGDLDQPRTLHRLAGLADTIIHLAPPPAVERTASVPTHHKAGIHTDSRTRNLLAALSRGKRPQRLIYISTSGVYGDCKGERVNETRPVKPLNARAKLRIDAETRLRLWGIHNKVSTRILRVPGIYSADRLPVERLKKGTPAIVPAEDGYTNHIHADDLALCIVAALQHGKTNRIYHTVDDSHLKMGEYFDAVADTFDLPHPPRITRSEAQKVLSPMLLSFMNESRQLENVRMKKELKVSLAYPTVAETLATIKPRPAKSAVQNKTTGQPAAAQLEMFPAANLTPRSQ